MEVTRWRSAPRKQCLENITDWSSKAYQDRKMLAQDRNSGERCPGSGQYLSRNTIRELDLALWILWILN